MDIHVNKNEWAGLSQEDQKKIQAIIQAHFSGGTVVGHATALPAAQFLNQAKVYKFGLSAPICKAACGVAEAAAVAACSMVNGPAGAVCVAAAHAAGEFCREKC